MARVVDSIIAELIVKNEAYVRGFNEATAAHERFLKSTTALKSNTFDLQAEGQKYKAGADRIAQSEDQLTQKVTRTRKARADAVKQSGNTEVQAEIATQQRITKAVEDGIAARSAAVRKGSGTRIGATVSGRANNARQGLLTGVSSEAVAQNEVNAARLDAYDITQKLRVADGEDAVALSAQLEWLRRIDTYKKAGLTETQAQLRAETEMAAIAKLRAGQEEKQALAQKSTGRGRFGGANEFALQASGGRFGYSFSPGAIAGVAVAAGVAAGVEAIDQATKFAVALNDVSKQAGISAEALQVYYRAAQDTGAKTTDVDQALAHLADQLAKARTGSKDAQKAFDALGVSFKGNETAGQLLPTLIDRISQVGKESRRNAAELDLFGDAGKRLDGALSGGNDKVKELAAGMAATGDVLSDQDVARLAKLATTLDDVKQQLLTHVSGVVSENAASIADLAKQFENLAASIADAVGSALRAFRSLQNSQAGQDFAAVSPVAFGGRLHDAIADKISNDPRLKQAGSHLRQLFGLNPAGPDYDAQTAQIDALSAKYPNIQDMLRNQIKPGKPNNSLLDKLNAPNGRKGPSQDALDRQAEQRTKQYNDRIAAFQQEQIRAREQMTGSIQEQAKDEDQIAKIALQRQLDDIESQRKENLTRKGVDAALENRRAAELKRQAIATEQAESDAREQDVAERYAQQQERIFEDKLAVDREGIDARQALARTDKDRLRLALDSLSKEQEAERSSLQSQIDTLKPGDPTRKSLEYRRDALPGIYADRAAAAQRQNAGPLGSYIDSLPRSAQEVDEAFQDAAVHGLQSFNTQLGNGVSKMLHLHGIAGQLIDDIAQIGIKWAEAQLFGAGTPGASSGGGFGSLIGGIGKLLGIGGGGAGGGWDSLVGASIGGAQPTSMAVSSIDFSGLGGWAGGGSGVIGGKPGVDQNVLSLNGTPIRKVGRGELLSVSPNTAVDPNQRVNSQPSQITVLAPRHYDLSNSLIDRDTLAQMNAENRDYADQISQARAGQAVQVAGSRAPGIVRKTQTLKG